MNTTTIPVYTVSADAATGEWLDEAEPTGATTTLAAWGALVDKDSGGIYGLGIHFDTYDVDGETRAVAVHWTGL